MFKRILRNTLLAWAACAAVLACSAHAAVISFVKVTNDADCGISTANTYTHTIDFEQSATGKTATINGVAFTSLSGNNATFTRTVANGNATNHNGAGVVSTCGGLLDLMTGFLYNNNPSTDGTGKQTYTITGLTVGTMYDLRIYSHNWVTNDTRVNTLVFDPSGAADSTGPIDQDHSTTVGMPNNTDSYYINYRYTATSTSLTWTAANAAGSNASWHLYGLTNQVVPEPATMLVLMAGGLAALLKRRRSRS